MINYTYRISVIFLYIILSSCQEGLKPDEYEEVPTTSYLTGTIEFIGGKEKFPDSSEVFGIYVAAFKQLPKDSSGIVAEILKGNVYLKFESLPYPADSSEFSLEIKDAPVNIEYLAVSMQTDSVKIDAQKIIGVYTITEDNTKPSNIQIEKGKTYNVRIKVDWDSLPPQPF
ncbi:MAG: hypothetical protein V1779_02620 [bacterium]